MLFGIFAGLPVNPEFEEIAYQVSINELGKDTTPAVKKNMETIQKKLQIEKVIWAEIPPRKMLY